MRKRTAGALVTAACAVAFTTAALGSSGARAATALPVPTPTVPGLPTPPVHTPTVPPLPTPTVPPLPTPTLPPPPTVPPIPTLPSSAPPPPGTPPGSVPPGGTTVPPGSAYVPGGTSPYGGAAATVPGGGTVGSTSAVLGQLLGLLGAPPGVGIELPNLEHFSVNVPSGSAAAHHGRPGGSGAAGWLAIACSLLVGAALALRGTAVAGALRRRAALAVAPVAAALGIAAVVVGVRAPAIHTASAAVRSPSAQAAIPMSYSEVPAAGQQLLERVSALEAQIARQAAQVQLLSNDAQVTQTIAQAPPRTAAAPSVDPAAAERASATGLEATVQQEYAVFAAIAKNPAQSSALVAAAAAQPAGVRDPVTYDVQAVEAAAAQQAAIAAAGKTGPALPAGAVPTLSAPLTGPITQGFGPTPFVFEPSMRVGSVVYPHFHTGLDIAAARDTPVGAAAAGVVALAGSQTDGLGHLVGFGNYVVVAHGGGLVTLYGHLDRILVNAGQAVQAGQILGLEGSSGNSTGPHLHFEVRYDGAPVNPLDYLANRTL